MLVSHAMDEVNRLCDAVVLLDAGRVIAEGTPSEITAQARAADLEEAFVCLTGRALQDDMEEN
ncbi:ATP-binding cassette domain-containing protein, partial [Hoyosella subflava]|uniref:ABC transporter-like protein protein n=1 Tax=Hoyosella subflava (strain DSM 45089 / JCM 17490 / NBRC 109087 / DQS3-9A1) TaxID=443218 RepID=F6EGT5_HOYSD